MILQWQGRNPETICPLCRRVRTGYHGGRFTTLNNVSIITAPAMGQGLLGGEKCDLVQYLLRLLGTCGVVIEERSAKMQLGMIGLGRMGASMVSRLLQGGHECVVFVSLCRTLPPGCSKQTSSLMEATLTILMISGEPKN